MMEIFIGKEGQERGPYTRLQIRQMLESGEIDRNTLGWMQGEDGWKPLHEIPVVAEIIQNLEREQLDAARAQDPGPPPLPKQQVSYEQLSAHAFSRFGARMLDVIVFHAIILMIISPEGAPEDSRGIWESFREGPTEEQQSYAYRMALIKMSAFLGWHLIEAVLLATVGTTLGKSLFNLRVQTTLGAKLSLITSLGRSLMVWIMGMAAGVTLFQGLANFLSFRRLQLHGMTTWDRLLQTEVKQGPISRTRWLTIILLFFAAAYARQALMY